MPVPQETRPAPYPDQPNPESVTSPDLLRDSARDERVSEAELQYLGLELDDPDLPSDQFALKTVIVTALAILYVLDVKFSTEINITSLYVVVIFLALSLKRVRWVLGVTIASLVLNMCALRWDELYPPVGWSPKFAVNHLLMAAGAQVPAGILAYRSLVAQNSLNKTRAKTMNRQRVMYESERAARAAEQEARQREQQALEDLRLHAEELTRIIESEREARRRENEARMQAREAMGERDYLRSLTEDFQRTLLPKIPPVLADGQLLLGSLYQPAIQEMQMGGDFYDAMALPNAMVGLVIGDVAGHGVEAAALTAFVTTTLRAFATEDPLSPGRVLARVNRSLTLDQHFDAFVSVFYGVYDPITGNLRYANAGHEPPILLHSDDSYDALDSTGLVVGVDTTALYEEREFALAAGDTIILLTDGLTEAREAETRHMLGWNGVARLAIEQRHELNDHADLSLNGPSQAAPALDLAHGLYQAAARYAGDGGGEIGAGRGLTDDVALLVVVAADIIALAETPTIQAALVA
jgi:serine phosphatase RsbU (regulator of sigma subunit)